jgi:tetratricopeptide (TPR) repeat protein
MKGILTDHIQNSATTSYSRGQSFHTTSRLSSLAPRLALLSFGALLFSTGCTRFPTAKGAAGLGNTIQTDVANSSPGNFSSDTARTSKSLHHFIVGQLSLVDEDFEGALRNFEQADALSDEPSALIHTKMADLYLRSGQLDKARGAAEKAMAEDPSEPYVRMLYAGVLEGLGKDAEAEPLYRDLTRDFPQKVDGYLLLSNLYVKDKNLTAAADTLSKLIKNVPNEPMGHFYLGRVYELSDKLPKAEAEYEWVFKNDPNLSNGSTELLRVLVREKKNTKAKAVCDQILAKDPNNALARKVLSHLMLGESKLDDALRHLQILEGIEVDPSETRFKVALIQIEKQNFREAVRELSLVLASNPKHAEARYYLASIYAGTGKSKEAIEELKEIDDESPMYVKAKTFAAFIHRQNDDLDDALSSVDDALTIEPTNMSLVLYRVMVLRELHELKEAEKQLRTALSQQPQDERLLFNLGLVLHDRGKPDEALEVMRRLVAVNSRHSDALNFIAYALAESGKDLERAEQLIRQALSVRPSDGYYLDTLGFIQWKRGNLKEAQETLSRAISSASDDSVIVEHYVDVLLELGEERQAVSAMKTFMEQVGDGSAERDREKQDATKRLRKKLDELLQRRPELNAVEKMRLTPAARVAKPPVDKDALHDIAPMMGAS